MKKRRSAKANLERVMIRSLEPHSLETASRRRCRLIFQRSGDPGRAAWYKRHVYQLKVVTEIFMSLNRINSFNGLNFYKDQ